MRLLVGMKFLVGKNLLVGKSFWWDSIGQPENLRYL